MNRQSAIVVCLLVAVLLYLATAPMIVGVLLYTGIPSGMDDFLFAYFYPADLVWRIHPAVEQVQDTISFKVFQFLAGSK